MATDLPSTTVFALEKELAFNQHYSDFLLEICRDAAGHDPSTRATLQVDANFVDVTNNRVRFRRPCPICPTPTYHEVTWS